MNPRQRSQTEVAVGFLSPEHYDAAGGDEEGAEDDFGGEGFFEDEEGEENGDDDAEFVDGGDTRDVARPLRT